MKPSPTPTQWIIVALAASFATTLPFFIVQWARTANGSSVHANHGLPFTLLLSTLFLGGMALDLYAETRLENGLAAGRWSTEQVDAVRRWITRRSAALASLLVLAFFGIVLYLSHPGHTAPGMMLFWPAMAISRLGTLLNPKTTSPDRILEPPAAQLTSSHWGQRP